MGRVCEAYVGLCSMRVWGCVRRVCGACVGLCTVTNGRMRSDVRPVPTSPALRLPNGNLIIKTTRIMHD